MGEAGRSANDYVIFLNTPLLYMYKKKAAQREQLFVLVSLDNFSEEYNIIAPVFSVYCPFWFKYPPPPVKSQNRLLGGIFKENSAV